MRAEQRINSEPKDVFKVSEWKTELDPTEPLWRRLYYRWIHLPYLNFSFGVIKVPPAKQVIVEADKRGKVRRTFGWFEDLAILEHEDQADAACLNEHSFYTRLPYGRVMPGQSAQYEYGAPTFPRKKNPRKWAKPTLSLIIKDRKQDERKDQEWKACLAKLNEILDRQ